jgi:hypothetical protein
MNDKLIAQFEMRLEKITEGLFAHFFGKRIQAHDIALELVRALEDAVEPAADGDNRPVAPDQFTIHVHPEVYRQISQQYPSLSTVLGEQLVELAASAGYRLRRTPDVHFLVVPDQPISHVRVVATHTHTSDTTTAALQPIRIPDARNRPVNAQIIIGGQQIIPLAENIIHIGRGRHNDLVLDDAYVSRSHAQIRLRFGHYTIFDTDSQSGTYVNNVRVREHRLQAGDVIRIGHTSMVYMEDEPDPLEQTDAFRHI